MPTEAHHRIWTATYILLEHSEDRPNFWRSTTRYFTESKKRLSRSAARSPTEREDRSGGLQFNILESHVPPSRGLAKALDSTCLYLCRLNQRSVALRQHTLQTLVQPSRGSVNALEENSRLACGGHDNALYAYKNVSCTASFNSRGDWQRLEGKIYFWPLEAMSRLSSIQDMYAPEVIQIP